MDREGKILAQGRKPMVANGTAQAGLDAVIGAIDSMMSEAHQKSAALESARLGRSIRSLGLC